MMLAAGAFHVTAPGANAIDILDILFGSGRQNRPSPQRVLQNGHTVTALAGSPGMRQYFQIDIRPGTGRLTVGTTGGAGDCDLYLSRGALPEPKSYQYVSNGNGANEAITISGPAPGTWYALVYGYGRFGGVSLTAAWSIGQPHRPRPVPIPQTWIRITGPAAGGVLTAGESYWVQWTTSGHSRRIRVLQSFDDGRTWTDIAPRSTALASAGRLIWTVPFVHGRTGPATARIRIVDTDSPLIHATGGPWAVMGTRGGRGRPGRPDGHGGPGNGEMNPYEPNNQTGTASRIEVNSVQYHRIDKEGDEDWLVFVPPTTGAYRVAFTDVRVELKVRLYSAKVGSDRESKYRTFTVKKGREYSLDFDVGPTVRYMKLHVQADDDDDTGGYRVVFQRVGHDRPAVHPRGPARR
jgi:hypothetical protein